MLTVRTAVVHITSDGIQYQGSVSDKGGRDIKATLAPKRPLVPGFPVTLISRCLTEQKIHIAISNARRLELRLVRAYRRATVT